MAASACGYPQSFIPMNVCDSASNIGGPGPMVPKVKINVPPKPMNQCECVPASNTKFNQKEIAYWFNNQQPSTTNKKLNTSFNEHGQIVIDGLEVNLPNFKEVYEKKYDDLQKKIVEVAKSYSTDYNFNFKFIFFLLGCVLALIAILIIIYIFY